MSASYIYFLQKRELILDDYEAEAEAVIHRNDKRLFRIKEINIKLLLKTSDPKVVKRMEQCNKFFEQYFTVTESVRKGIDVNLKIDY